MSTAIWGSEDATASLSSGFGSAKFQERYLIRGFHYHSGELRDTCKAQAASLTRIRSQDARCAVVGTSQPCWPLFVVCLSSSKRSSSLYLLIQPRTFATSSKGERTGSKARREAMWRGTLSERQTGGNTERDMVSLTITYCCNWSKMSQKLTSLGCTSKNERLARRPIKQ